ncbi:hypothetical protein RDWZM_009101 [Blomia tropicalis]|uniref:Serine/threonine-protein phosphatase n=1 Tax=Blomia tropicalis TaxID=40697 RepID=A0A9Q0RKP1_BLOTA|nr:hypothetical protein RDWZM_009101 [Blomia tropicalis]
MDNTTKNGSFISPMITSNYSNYQYQNIIDSCALIVHCEHHNRVALYTTVDTKTQNRFQWFPFAYTQPSQTWSQNYRSILSLIIGQPLKDQMIKQINCLNLFRLQLSRNQRFVTRLIYYIQLDSSKIDLCNTATSPISIEWVSIVDASKGRIGQFWGPEIEYFCTAINQKQPLIGGVIMEYSLREAYNVQFSNHEFSSILNGSQITQIDIQRIYDDFIEHCFPCFPMSRTSFEQYLIKHRIETNMERLKHYWNAWKNHSNSPFMTFHELLIGLVIIDRYTNHGELRLRYIFKFYDRDKDGKLNRIELKTLIQDLMYPNVVTTDKIEECLNEKFFRIKLYLNSRMPSKLVNRDCKQSKEVTDLTTIDFETFLVSVLERIITGTSRLCRSCVPVFSSIQRSFVTRRLEQTFTKKYSFKQIITNNNNQMTKCSGCISKSTFQLSQHVIVLNDQRRMKSVFKNIDQQSRITTTSLSNHSFEIQFNNRALANLYLKRIRDFCRSKYKGTARKYNGLFEMMPKVDHHLFEAEISAICTDVRQVLLRNKEHIIDLQSPIIVIGDIHGNLEDLLTLESIHWSTVPFFTGKQILFLGDYVDRGRWSFECAIYLFCLKILAPDKITLLRGNHEVRSVQLNYSYVDELKSKYGSELGLRLFEYTNKVFDCLPYCAIVDRVIFCAHGGIPYSNIGIRELLQKYPKITSDIEMEGFEILWQILWSDPVDSKELRNEYELLIDLANRSKSKTKSNRHNQYRNMVTPEDQLIASMYQFGFLPNRKRCTAYLFNEQAFNEFCTINQFTHMIRAHEVPINGYRFHFKYRCITTFSCSHYCGHNNQCAVIQIADNRIRVLQINTMMNNPATT